MHRRRLPVLACLATAALGAACTGSDEGTASPAPTASRPSLAPFEGDLIGRAQGTGNHDFGTITLRGDAELYLQCPEGGSGVTVDYRPVGLSSCPSGGSALVAQVSASHYPAAVHVQVRSAGPQQWVLALDSHPVETQLEEQ